MGDWVIRYRYPGTTNGKPVGVVYVDRLDWHPDAPNVCSYVFDPEEATTWATQSEAEAFAVGKHWPEAEAVRRGVA